MGAIHPADVSDGRSPPSPSWGYPESTGIPSGFIEGRSPYSARTGFIAETLPEALRDVHWYADRGYIQIKIYNSMNPEWVKPLAAEAHALGLRVVGHVPAFTTPDRMIEDGYDEITHINQLMLGWLIKRTRARRCASPPWSAPPISISTARRCGTPSNS